MKFLKTISIPLLLAFWVLAALVVVFAQSKLELLSPLAADAVKIAGIVAAGFGYMRLNRGLSAIHAFVVGITWVLLDIVTEITMTVRTGHAWFDLLGSPSAPALRAIFLLSWLGAAALFARRRITVS